MSIAVLQVAVGLMGWWMVGSGNFQNAWKSGLLFLLQKSGEWNQLRLQDFFSINSYGLVRRIGVVKDVYVWQTFPAIFCLETSTLRESGRKWTWNSFRWVVASRRPNSTAQHMVDAARRSRCFMSHIIGEDVLPSRELTCHPIKRESRKIICFKNAGWEGGRPLTAQGDTPLHQYPKAANWAP